MSNCADTITLIETGKEGKPHLTWSLPSQSQNIYERKTLFSYWGLTSTRDENTLGMEATW